MWDGLLPEAIVCPSLVKYGCSLGWLRFPGRFTVEEKGLKKSYE